MDSNKSASMYQCRGCIFLEFLTLVPEVRGTSRVALGIHRTTYDALVLTSPRPRNWKISYPRPRLTLEHLIKSALVLVLDILKRFEAILEKSSNFEDEGEESSKNLDLNFLPVCISVGRAI